MSTCARCGAQFSCAMADADPRRSSRGAALLVHLSAGIAAGAVRAGRQLLVPGLPEAAY
jgi:hypothetical protein